MDLRNVATVVALGTLIYTAPALAEPITQPSYRAQMEDETVTNKTRETAVAEPKPQETHWRISIGASIAWPKLREANSAVHEVEGQVREIAPGVNRFQDWNDVLKGSIGIGIAYGLDIKGIRVWPELYYSKGVGSIETKQSNIETIYGGPMDRLHFKQEYNCDVVNVGAMATLTKWKGLSIEAGAYLTISHLTANTSLETSIPEIGTSHNARGKFSQWGFGFAPSINLNMTCSQCSPIR